MPDNYCADAPNPLCHIDTSFERYLMKRKVLESEHCINGIPDYAFALDYELHDKIIKIPHFYSMSKKITESLVAQRIQIVNQQGIAAGPNQFADIYKMGADCAKILGIGIPNIYVINDTNMNAYTLAADDASPLIVLHSGIIERLTSGELKCVIAHECGHIHNNHTVLQTVIRTILDGGTGVAGFILSLANMALMQFWTRAEEITADRAAVICSDDVEDAYSVNVKLLYGSVIGREYDINYAALRKQLDMTLDNPSRILEIYSDHPSSLRRIFAEMAFAECETLYHWRPEFQQPDMRVRSREEVEEKCKKLVNIVENN